MCKYTFLLPAYKSRYLFKAIESILNQTFPDFKIIIVDDASPENLKEIVNLFNDNRLNYIRNQYNIGSKNLCDNWHFCLQYVQSEYMILASDDDVYEKEFLEYVNYNVNKYPECNIFRGNTRIIDACGHIEKEDSTFNTTIVPLDEYLLKYFPKQVRCIANTVYKTNWIKKHGYNVYDLAWHSDNMTAFKAAFSNGIVLIGEKNLFNFRVSGINISSIKTNNSILRKSKASSAYFSDLSNLIKKLPISRFKRLIIRLKYLRNARITFYGYAITCHQKDRKQIYNDIEKCSIFNPIQKIIYYTIMLKIYITESNNENN